MVRLVLKLSRAAKIGALLVVGGVCLAIYGRMRDVLWAARASVPLVIVGAALYYWERYKDVKRRRKP